MALVRATGSIGEQSLTYCGGDDCINGSRFSKGCNLSPKYVEATPEIEDYEDGFRMKIPFSATATAAAGPFGISGIFTWTFKNCPEYNPPTSSGDGIGLLLL
jgi:hypothetical protein